MSWVDVIILSLIQGITEFLPISSSGHLALMHGWFGSDIQAARHMDIAVHLGTLLAVMIYFRSETMRLIHGALSILGIGGQDSEGNKALVYKLILASLPIIIIGAMVHLYVDISLLYSPVLIGVMSIAGGVLLGLSDCIAPATSTVSYRSAFLIGLSQILALIPGMSRSGICMTMGRFLGLDRITATRFALLLSYVAIGGASVLGGFDMLSSDAVSVDWSTVLASVLASAISAYIAISVMMAWLAKSGFMPFVIYRIALGVVLVGIYAV